MGSMQVLKVFPDSKGNRCDMAFAGAQEIKFQGECHLLGRRMYVKQLSRQIGFCSRSSCKLTAGGVAMIYFSNTNMVNRTSLKNSGGH